MINRVITKDGARGEKNLFHESYQLQNVNKKLDRTLAKKFLLKVCNIYLSLTEFEVRTVSYGPSFFPLIYGPSAKHASSEMFNCHKDCRAKIPKTKSFWLLSLK